MSDARLVTGLFISRAAAQAAVRELIATGYVHGGVAVLTSGATREKEFGAESGTKAPQDAAFGASIAVPGLGLIVAGPFAAAPAGAGAGAPTRGPVGLLVGSGIPEHRAKVYEAGLCEGGFLLGVEAKSDKEARAVETLFDSLGAHDVRQE